MSDSQWICQKCGKRGGFELMGSGFIMCSGCAAWHIVSASGKIQRVGKCTPEFLPFIRLREEAYREQGG